MCSVYVYQAERAIECIRVYPLPQADPGSHLKSFIFRTGLEQQVYQSRVTSHACMHLHDLLRAASSGRRLAGEFHWRPDCPRTSPWRAETMLVDRIDRKLHRYVSQCHERFCACDVRSSESATGVHRFSESSEAVKGLSVADTIMSHTKLAKQ